MAKSVKSDTRLEVVRRTVCLEGVTEIMFDRYAGDNNTKLSWDQKVYLRPGEDRLVIPTTNISSFLSSHNTNSAPKRLRDARQYKKIANACLSFVQIEGEAGYVDFLRDEKPIRMGEIEGDEKDPLSGIYLDRRVARLAQGVPNPKERPVMPLPWSLKFNVIVLPNKEIKEQEIRNLFEDGGLAIGLGTFRGVFGKFVVVQWE